MSELSSRLLKSLLYEDLSSKTMSAAGDLSAAAQHLPDVERRRCWSILESGSFHWFLPHMPSDQKNGGSALDAPRFAGRKEWPLKLFSSSWRLFEQKLCSPFCTEMIRPDRAWTGRVSTPPPPRASRSSLRALQRSDSWKLNERRMRMRWNTVVIDRENVLARSERACRWFWNETWNF